MSSVPFDLATDAVALRSDHELRASFTSGVMQKVVAGEPQGVEEAIADLQCRVLAQLDAEDHEVLPVGLYAWLARREMP